MEQTLKYELTVSETNAILGALGNLPFVQVADLVNKIKTQAFEQMNPSEEKKASSEE